jgi:hypothetical protein
MMMMLIVTPSLDSIEHKLNSKSIKFPKLCKNLLLLVASLGELGDLGDLGDLEPKTENRKPKFFSLFSCRQQLPKIKF